MWVETVIFYVFAAIAIGSALMVITARQPVHAVLFLVVTFFASAGLWLLLNAEFLALVLVLVYVGAVMTLFLFVVMMLNLDLSKEKEKFVRYLPLGIIVIALFVTAIIYAVGPEYFGFHTIPPPPPVPANYSNTAALGDVLYTTYAYPFELAGVLLLVAIIAAITLSLRHSRGKTQNIRKQLQAEPDKRVRLVKMPSEKSQRGLQ